MLRLIIYLVELPHTGIHNSRTQTKIYPAQVYTNWLGLLQLSKSPVIRIPLQVFAFVTYRENLGLLCLQNRHLKLLSEVTLNMYTWGIWRLSSCWISYSHHVESFHRLILVCRCYLWDLNQWWCSAVEPMCTVHSLITHRNRSHQLKLAFYSICLG